MTEILTAAQIAEIRARCAGNAQASLQAEWFIEADFLGDPDAQQYAGNPDLVAALGGTDAYTFLGI